MMSKSLVLRINFIILAFSIEISVWRLSTAGYSLLFVIIKVSFLLCKAVIFSFIKKIPPLSGVSWTKNL